MALMLEKTYAAFIKAGADEASAREASAELAQHEAASIKTEMAVQRWMLGSVLAVCIMNLGLLLNLTTRHL